MPRAPRDFTPAQEAQANAIGFITSEHRAARRRVRTHPIDVIEPEELADRDDGIFVETEQRGGGYRIHVTIADVAAFVKAHTPLARAAGERVQTLYWPHLIDSMFPKLLEGRLSLEHLQERLGLNVSLDLDEHFKPVHLEFEPIITRAETASYRHVQAHMQDNPQFNLMAKVAAGLEDSMSPQAKQMVDDLLRMMEKRRPFSTLERDAMKMVATYMVTINNNVAEFADRSKLPFVFRTFENDVHANYTTQSGRHVALERSGMRGRYCHFTSPIRRAPDFFNGHMIHYAIAQIQEIEKRILQNDGMIDREALHYALWQHAPELLSRTMEAREGGTQPLASLKHTLKQVIEPVVGYELPSELLNRLTVAMRNRQLPYDREQLQTIADHCNRVMHSAIQREVKQEQQKAERIEDLKAQYTPEKLEALNAEQFSRLLRDCATMEDVPRRFYEEALRRIETGKANIELDGYTILVEANYPNVLHWNTLKQAVIKAIKHKPGNVSGIFKRMRQEYPGQIELLRVEIPVKDEQVLDGQYELPGITRAADSEQVHSAIVTYSNGNGRLQNAPFYSVGHNDRAAKSHAIFSFLENYAFGDLVPFGQIEIPNLLYAELDNGKYSRQSVVETMVREIEGQLLVNASPREDGFVAYAQVSGRGISGSIFVEGEGKTQADAEQSALRRLLRNNNFKYAVSRERRNPRLHPLRNLREAVAHKEWEMSDIIYTDIKDGFLATVTVGPQGAQKDYSQKGPNKDRAGRAACIEALEAIRWEGLSDEPQTEQGKSWVSDLVDERKPRSDYRRFSKPGMMM